MIWDYCESVPIGNWTGNWAGGVEWIQRNVEHLSIVRQHARVYRASATRCPIGDNAIDALITDPPYYDAVPYSDLSDFFYVWHKRAIGQVHRDLFRTPLTPKTEELIAYYGTGKRKVQKPPEWYEARMYDAFVESRRILRETGVACVMFAHKTTSAWEAIISGLLRAGIIVTSSWPLHTERATRMVAHNAAALASSITLVCRRRAAETGDGLWDDVRIALKEVAKERLDFFWNQNIRGADFFISAIGPALSVFGKYQRVTKLSGEEVTVGQFLDEVRALVTNYALAKIMKTSHTGTIDGESQFYVIWRWSYADAKVPADESFKLAQALGMATETMWDRTGVLEKSGENVLAMPIAKRMKIKDLGDSEADGAPASLIDVLHRLCAFREKNDSDGMAQFLIRSGQGNNPALWVVAQAMSDILPDGDKEKQLMQGLLNQKERLEQAAEQGRLF
jgi:adenine-specific DNA methylase